MCFLGAARCEVNASLCRVPRLRRSATVPSFGAEHGCKQRSRGTHIIKVDGPLVRQRNFPIVRGGSPEPPRELLPAGAFMRHSCAAGQETRRANMAETRRANIYLALSH
jgi:hypothetical protein